MKLYKVWWGPRRSWKTIVRVEGVRIHKGLKVSKTKVLLNEHPNWEDKAFETPLKIQNLHIPSLYTPQRLIREVVFV